MVIVSFKATAVKHKTEVISLQKIKANCLYYFREVKAQLKKECIERVTVDINNELVKEILTEMVADTADDVFETDVKQRLKQLYDLERLVKLSHAGRFWNKWKNEYKAVTKLKRAMEEFPCAPNMQSQKEQLQTLLNVGDERIMDRKFFVSKRAKLTIETPLEIEKHRKETETCALVHRLYRNLLHQTAWAPLDLGRVVGKLLNRKNKWSQHQSKYLKKDKVSLVNLNSLYVEGILSHCTCIL